MVNRGFTVVELIITITIMGILLILAIVNVNASQLQARDTERKADVEAIATALENFYKTGTDGSTNLGRYPSTGLNVSTAAITINLRDVNIKSFMAPGIEDAMETFVAAQNNLQTTTDIIPSPNYNQYVYQPLMPDGSICTPGNIDCRKFNLYYRLESDDTVYKVTSKNQ